MKKYIILIIGFIIIAFGVSMMINVNYVGLEPWAAVNVGLSEISLTYGAWNAIIQAIFITITWIIEKRPPRLGTFLNMVIVSVFVDFFVSLNLFPKIESLFLSYLFFTLGIFVASVGASLAIVTNKGVGAKTQFYVTLYQKTNFKIGNLKYMMEAIGLSLAILVGGPIFLGTIIFVFTSGHFIGKLVPFFERKLKMKIK